MIIRTLDEVIGTERDVDGGGWRSRRLLLKRDAMGFSLHDTVLEAGWEQEMEYANHLEACYIIHGEAEITDLATGETHELRPGTVYALDAHDRHLMRVKSEMRLICVFNPALAGGETHNESGGFEAALQD